MRMNTKRNSLSIAQKIEILKKVSEGVVKKPFVSTTACIRQLCQG